MTFKTWTDLISGVTQVLVLGPLLFSICLNALSFYLQEIDICNFADPTNVYACNEILESIWIN